MLPSLHLALNNLSGKRGRTALIIGAVALASALIVAVSCAINTVQASMEIGLVRILGRADARIIHQFSGRFDEDVLERVRTWPEVDRATGRLAASVSLVHADRRARGDSALPLRAFATAIGVEYDFDATLTNLEIVEGRYPTAPNEVLLDRSAAAELQAAPGDNLIAEGDPLDAPLTVAGIYQRDAMLGGTGRNPLVRFDRQALARITGHHQQMTSIMIALREGEDVRAFCDRYAPSLPGVLALEPAEMVRSGFDRRIEASRFGVIITSILVFISAAFIIVTAMTTSVIERQREMALARSIGASRGQLFGAQLTVGAVMASLGAAVGVPLGIALTASLVWWFREHLHAGLVMSGQGLLLAGAGALASGLLGGVYPAFLASSVTPLEAMTRRARPPRITGLALACVLGVALVVVQLVLMLISDSDTRFYSYAIVGLPALHIGYFILAVPVLMLIATGCGGALSALLRLPRGMLSRTVIATPYRNGFTAGALMVGISMLVSTWGGGTALLNGWVNQIRFGDAFVSRRTGIPSEQQQAIASLPFVRSATAMTYLPVRVVGRQVFGVEGMSPPTVLCIGLDPHAFFSINALEWIAGDPQQAIQRLREGDAIVVADRFLIAGAIGVGDRLTLGPPGGSNRNGNHADHEFEVVGVVSAAGLDIASQVLGARSAYMEFSVSNVFMDIEAVRRRFDNHDAYVMQLELASDISDEAAQDAVAAVAPGVTFRSGRWILETINDVARTLLTVQSVIAFAALVLACIGVGNIIMANIHGRRYEYGVLRAAGAQRGLLLRLIFGEALILALTGAAVGTMLGMHLTWVSTTMYRDLAGISVDLIVPFAPTAIGWAALACMTLLVALPAAISIMRRTPSALLASGRNG